MDQVEQLVKTTLSELKSIVQADTVIGEPITAGDTKIIPIVKVGFGFGAGGGGGKATSKAGQRSGSGGGAGLEPLAFLIVDESGARLEPVNAVGSGNPSPADRIFEFIKSQVLSRLDKSGKAAEEDTAAES